MPVTLFSFDHVIDRYKNVLIKEGVFISPIKHFVKRDATKVIHIVLYLQRKHFFGRGGVKINHLNKFST